MDNIFFDLDGTLIESRPRLYQLFQYMVPKSKLTFDEYWAYKRNKISHQTILRDIFSYTIADIGKFEKEWLEKIELEEWLSLDKPFDGVSDYLKKLSDTYKLFIITSRQFENRALNQIYKFDWSGVIEDIFVTGRTQEKYELIKMKMPVNLNDWLVGDTGKDIQTGKRLGINTAAVLTGFLSEKALAEYSPDLIVNTITELPFS